MQAPARELDRAPGSAVLVAIAWAACEIAANGFLSLALDVEVVPERGAGPLVAPLAIVAATLALLGLLLRRVPRQRTLLVPLECALLIYLVLVVVGALAYAAARGIPADALLFAARSATSPFTAAGALLAALAGLIFVLTVAAARAGAGRPRWPWERDED